MIPVGIVLFIVIAGYASYYVGQKKKTIISGKSTRFDKRTKEKVISRRAGSYSSFKIERDHSGIFKKDVSITKFSTNNADSFFQKYGYKYADIRHLVKENIEFAMPSMSSQIEGVKLAFFINEDLFLIINEYEKEAVIRMFENEKCSFDYIKKILYRKDWISLLDSSIVEIYADMTRTPNAFNAALGGELFGPAYAVGELIDYRRTVASIVRGNFYFIVKNTDHPKGEENFWLNMNVLKDSQYGKAFVTFLRFNQFVNEYFECVKVRAKPWDV